MIDWILMKFEPDKENTQDRHPKCKLSQCNHPLDPIEYECSYYTIIDCDQCKYGGGRKDPEAKCNQEI